MSSRKYRSLVFAYTNDRGITSIKHERLTVNDSNQTIVPVVPLLQSLSYSTNSKLESLPNRLRHLDMQLNQERVNVVVPFAPNQLNQLKTYIQEVINTPNVINAEYVGESSNEYSDCLDI